jgi:hypothetical protein
MFVNFLKIQMIFFISLAILEVLTSVSEEPIATIFTRTLKMEAVSHSKTLVYTSSITRHINPRVLYVKLHCHENFKPQF